MQKHMALFAMFVMGASSSVKAVEKNATAKGGHPNYFSAIEVINDFTRFLDQTFKDIYIKRDYLTSFLDFALRCSILPKDSSKQEKVNNLLGVLGSKARSFDRSKFFEANPNSLKYFVNKLLQLDFKDIIDCVTSDNGGAAISIERYMVDTLAADFICLALEEGEEGKKDAANYFYEKIIKSMPEKQLKLLNYVSKFNEKNKFNARLLKHANEYINAENINAENIIQDLLKEPYSITPDDVDCAFWLGCNFNCSSISIPLNSIDYLFSNKGIKPSIEVVKEAVRTLEDNLTRNKPYTDDAPQVDLALRFLRSFIDLHETKKNFDFKELGSIVKEFQSLDKHLDQERMIAMNKKWEEFFAKRKSEYNNKMKINTINIPIQIKTMQKQNEEESKDYDVVSQNSSLNQSLSTQNQTTDSVNQSLSTLDDSLNQKASAQSKKASALDDPMGN